ncbi:MAG: CotH kinase family protein [Candidatus Poribacteria bacterium]|nr:CotH kinase family protein [Candidatus Poribacteria bacterium]
MNRYQKLILLLLGGIIFAIFLSRPADTDRKSYQLKKSENRQDFVRHRGFVNRQSSVNIPWPHTSNLPIVIIDTDGSWIPDEPKVPARIKIIYDESGGKNSLDNPHIHFEGKIGIEVRGQTSQGFPKKQYGFEFQDESGNDKDVSIFGLPAESDWVLNGPYSDKTLMRNYLAFEFSNRIGRYASRTKFVEVFLNTNIDKTIKAQHYVGVYLLIEKIKRGKERVAIQSLKLTHNKPPEITGGYILKIDKMDPQETFFYTRRGTHLAHVYPKGREMSHAQKVWIQNYMSNFETALAGPKFKDPKYGYTKYIDVDSFIDHFIINELFKNTDGFRLSAYMYKDKGGKLTAGPVWDFNFSMGNTVFHNGWETDSWLIYTNPVPFWWDRLLSDESFKQKLVKKWKTLRKNELVTSEILDEIDRTAEYLSEAQKRNFQRWRVLGHSLFGNPGPGRPTYQGEVDEMKTWLQTRLQWMDKNIELLPQKHQYSQRYRRF